ncbi:hypothetical protein Tco_1281113, partial [Tanacetum coccineum]
MEALRRTVKAKYGDTRPKDEFERVLYGDLRVMFEPDIKSDVWRMLQGYRVTTWKLIDSSGVHFVRFDNLHIFMLVERRYPLTPITITNMLNKKLQTDHQNEMCYQLLKLMIQKMNIKFRGGLLGLKRLHGFLEVTAAQVRNRSRFGINKWYQSFALRNFNLEDIELESTNSSPTAKLPILKLEEYEMWAIRIKQYFQIQDYAFWEVIKNEEKTKKKNDMKAKGLLLMALPNEHQLTFSQYLDAKSMFASIETRFRDNAATKKTQKTLLKQQYENFSATSAESLDSIFNMLHKIVSRIAILGVIIAQEDLNLKFLSSLPPEWNTHVVVWMNKPEIETISIDDLYNNFKIVEHKIKKTVGTSSGVQNLAIMTAPSSSSTNDANTASSQVVLLALVLILSVHKFALQVSVIILCMLSWLKIQMVLMS